MLMVTAVVAVACFTAFGAKADEEKEDTKPKHEIAEVMQKAMKGGLAAKVVKGEATDQEKKDLLEMYKSLAKHSPPKGPERAWNARTKALVESAAEVVEGKPGGPGKLEKAINCMSCHQAHRPS
jgi:hypothetical protein